MSAYARAAAKYLDEGDDVVVSWLESVAVGKGPGETQSGASPQMVDRREIELQVSRNGATNGVAR
jgi:hypothetical protein